MSNKLQELISTGIGQRVRLRNILIATDFSPASEAALNHAIFIARRFDSQLFIAHIISPASYGSVPGEAAAAASELTRHQAEREMTNLLISGRLRGLPHQVLVEEGAFWPVLSGMIRDHDIDLVVAGTHGRKGARKVFLGSVAEEIFRRAECPVLTVGPKVTGTGEVEAQLRQIVYATEFSPTSERALAYALSLAQEHQARLTLLHVVPEGPELEARGTAFLREYYAERLRRAVALDNQLGAETEPTVEFGNAAEKILGAARDRQADLIIMGAHAVSFLPGHVPSATAYKVVCQASCPVLTVRS